ncbi:molybdopterin biosynthesis protein MoeB [Sphingomonas sinipercae]|uniref:Molybdopterin biosynthesis protein MoeB n=1 Tax=Sphingomonas sinipercae TaxID=2714944 RepID=A0A6G7ZML3_9SPHN|nr:ThiF family adenylyltransferase [Sphingomonas sinipercae]QIL02158.1 molybdopterin biosynthesis protein MoeB [Sphingomonas sinipercae]
MTHLSDAELERYARHIVLPQVGGIGQRQLRAASVAIIGAGGIGSAVIPALAGAGIGKLTIIDDGTIDRSNLQRQTMFRDDQLGEGKALLAADYATALNPHVEVSPIAQRLEENGAEELLSGHAIVIDGSDNFATRLAVGDTLTRLRIPLISAAAVMFQGQVGLFRGWEADQPCYRCFVGDAFDSEDCDTCAEQGVVGALTATVGSFAALMAIRALARIGGDAAGKLFLFDGLALDWRTLRLPKNPGCRTCGA